MTNDYPKVVQYYGRFQSARGSLRGLPSWARFIVGVAAIPAIALASLSILVFLVSILALLLLTVPVYSLMKTVTGSHGSAGPSAEEMPVASDSPGRRRVEATVLEQQG